MSPFGTILTVSFLAFEQHIWGKSVGSQRLKMFETKSTLKREILEKERESERDWETMRHKQ